MAEYGKKLHIRKSGVVTDIKLYTTAQEVGTNYLNLRDGSTNLYAKLGATSEAVATNLQVRKGGTVYAVQREAVVKGQLIADISTTGWFVVPENVQYVSLNWVGEESEYTCKSSYTYNGCAVKRVPVIPGTKYSGFNIVTGYSDNAYADYWAGYFTYYKHPVLGNIPSYNPYADTWSYKVYTDTSVGIPFISNEVRVRYNELTGGLLPT